MHVTTDMQISPKLCRVFHPRGPAQVSFDMISGDRDDSAERYRPGKTELTPVVFRRYPSTSPPVFKEVKRASA